MSNLLQRYVPFKFMRILQILPNPVPKVEASPSKEELSQEEYWIILLTEEKAKMGVKVGRHYYS